MFPWLTRRQTTVASGRCKVVFQDGLRAWPRFVRTNYGNTGFSHCLCLPKHICCTCKMSQDWTGPILQCGCGLFNQNKKWKSRYQTYNGFAVCFALGAFCTCQLHDLINTHSNQHVPYVSVKHVVLVCGLYKTNGWLMLNSPTGYHLVHHESRDDGFLGKWEDFIWSGCHDYKGKEHLEADTCGSHMRYKRELTNQKHTRQTQFCCSS